MASEADQQLISPEAYFNRQEGWRSVGAARRRGVPFEDWCDGSDYWYPRLLVDYYRDSRTTPDVSVLGEPKMLGQGRGMVKTIPSRGDAASGCDGLAPAIQEAIDNKTEKGQMDDAPGLKWLTVLLEDMPGMQLWGNFGPGAIGQPPELDDISFTYFESALTVS